MFFGSLNARGCSTDEVMRRTIGEMLLGRKFDVGTLGEAKLKGKESGSLVRKVEVLKFKPFTCHHEKLPCRKQLLDFFM